MQVPINIAFQGVPVSEAVQRAVWRHGAELERFYDRMTGCHVVIAAPHRRQHKGALYSVRLDIAVPGEVIVVNKDHHLAHAHENVYIALCDAFHTARRVLEDYVRRARGQVKAHASAPSGRVARLFPEQGYGFIETDLGTEVYFNRRALQRARFGDLRLGDRVHFVENTGEHGPTAAFVRVVHSRAKEGVHEEAVT
ncbi:Cold shock-like protein [Phycisphaerales bacterium]|nr:Cold shock-like protein [Phycisphaerales bacterium]